MPMDNVENKSRIDPLMGVLLAVAGLLVALSLYQGAAYLDASRTAQATFAQVAAPKETSKTDVQSQVAQDKSTAGSLKKKNLFIPPEPPRNPVGEVAGILGNEALINGQWYKAGAQVGDGPNKALVVAIEPTRVRVKWNGQETEFLPLHASGESSSARGSGPGPGPSGPSGPSVSRRGGASVIRSEASVRPAPSRRGGPSPEEMAALSNASPEERPRLMEEMRQRYSGQ
jgi:hypothetical protein